MHPLTNLYLQLKMTPLHWAVERSHIQVIEILTQQGADINCENKVTKYYEK